MTKISQLFSSGHYQSVEGKIRNLINSKDDWLSKEAIGSTRATGDSIETIISNNFENLIGEEYCTSYFNDFSRKSMEDFAFEDGEGFYHAVDVKTHRIDTKFNMPNLISVERLSQFYKTDHNCFVILLVSYEVRNLQIVAHDVTFVPIEYLDWRCLSIGALGWGQIQIADSSKVIFNKKPNRAKWMVELCDVMVAFYAKEIEKTDARAKHFQTIKKSWLARM